MTTETLRCKPLNECTADDITPMDARLRADCIDYLASNGRSTRFTSPDCCTLQHLLRIVANVDDAVGCGPTEDGIITICEGGFAGHFAPPSTITRMRADEAQRCDEALQRAEDELDAAYYDHFGFAEM